MQRRLAIIILTLTLAHSTLSAQNGFNAPFSQYSFSQSYLPTSTPFASAMGGVVLPRAGYNFVNPFNPASYASVQHESFVFDISMSLQDVIISNRSQSATNFDGSLGSLSIAFPVTTHWKTSLGLLPYNVTNYSSTLESPVANTSQRVKTIYDGTGGISQFYWGNAFNIIGNGISYDHPTLQAGFNINYLYGSISKAITYDFIGDSSYQDLRSQCESHLSAVTFDLGVIYRQPLNPRYTLTTALTCKLPRTMTVDDKSLKYTYQGNYIIDTIFPLRGQSSSYESTLKQPLAIGLGLALERNQLWTIALDATYAEHSGMHYEEGNNSIFPASRLRYDNSMRLALGGGWLGNQGAPTYWGRIGLTGGLHYERGKLCLDLQQNGSWILDEWGAGIGITFPMRKGRSQLVITAAYSNFGDIDLLRTEMLTFGITLSSNERWFVKRKYN